MSEIDRNLIASATSGDELTPGAKGPDEARAGRSARFDRRAAVVVRCRVLLRAALAGLVLAGAAAVAAAQETAKPPDDLFPPELVEWIPDVNSPLFEGTGRDTWDREIRERGFILREPDGWRLWYTGYDSRRSQRKSLGLATSPDGIHWTRHPGNPIFSGSWTEDVFVVKRDGVYQMFAEGKDDVAHRLTSRDGVRWEDHGRLDVRTRSGAPLPPGPYGTPTVWIEDGTWHLYYEREDRGIWLATSTDLRVWTNVRDEPVIGLGPGAYDRHAVALNQVFRHRGHYYGLYHANADPEWKGPWTTCLAVSDDLVRWVKYPGNPIIPSDDSSAILVADGEELRLYTMHPAVKLWRQRAEGAGAP